MRHYGGISDDGANIVERVQGGSGRSVHGADRLERIPGQEQVPAECMADVSAHSFWKLGTTVMFDIRIINLNVSSYLLMTPEKALSKEEK